MQKFAQAALLAGLMALGGTASAFDNGQYDHVPADIPEKSVFVAKRRRQTAGVIVRFEQMPIVVAELVKTPGGAEPRGPATRDENVHD